MAAITASELLHGCHRVGPYDMLVGATALAQGYALATLNRRQFARVPSPRLRLVPTERFTS
jgi:predicted nucleic acid-binding protein